MKPRVFKVTLVEVVRTTQLVEAQDEEEALEIAAKVRHDWMGLIITDRMDPLFGESRVEEV